MQRLLPPFLFTLVIIAMVLSHLFFPLFQLLVSPWSWIGALPILAGLYLLKSGSNLFEKVGTNIKTFNDPETLVTNGVFAMSRNPMYLGFVLVLLGAALIMGGLGPLIFVVLFWLITDRWYIPFEENKMVEVFGEAYLEYQKQTRRWI